MAKSFKKKLRNKLGKIKRQTKREIVSRKKIIERDGGAKITIRNNQWVAKNSLKYIDTFKREGLRDIKTNIKRRKMLSLKSQVMDWFLEMELRSEKYNFNNILVVQDPYGGVPLVGVAIFSTIMDYKVRVTVCGKDKDSDWSFVYPETKLHRIPILGLYPNTTNTVVLELLDEEDETCDKRTFHMETGELPEELKGDVIRVKKKNENSAFSNILISGGLDIRSCVFDRNGDIRFYLQNKPKGYGIFPLSKGRFIFMERFVSTPTFANPHSIQMYDMDYLGRVGKTYFVKNGAHHTVEEKEENGPILTSGNSLNESTEDLVLEIDRNNGEILKKLDVCKIFDKKYQDMADWAHINSANMAVDGTMLVSMRNIHTVMNVDWETGKLRWILADPRFYEGSKVADKILKVEEGTPLFYQQHAVFEVHPKDALPGKRYIIVYDNHWQNRRKVEYFDGAKKSYINIYEIDEKEFSAKIYKRFSIPRSSIRSNAIFLPECNRVYTMNGHLKPKVNKSLGNILEVDLENDEILSEYEVVPGFFRAHGFEPDVVPLSKALVKNSNYLCGDLRRPERVGKKELGKIKFSETNVAKKRFSYVLREDVLYINQVDHDVKKVYFKGNNATFVVDFTDTWQTRDIFKESEYDIVMWLDEIDSDSYKMYIETEDGVLFTRKHITLS